MKQKTQKKKEKISIPTSWDTSDLDEINRRIMRSQSEYMQVTTLEPDMEYFCNYSVVGESGQPYIVEIRSLADRINSCTCADFDTNGLNTCKHIERVIFSLQKKGRKKFKRFAKEGSYRIEIYADPLDDTVKILWPSYSGDSFDFLKDFFYSDQKIISKVSIALPVIRRKISELPEEIDQLVRISNRLDEIAKREDILVKRQELKENFLEDIKIGKRSLDIMNLPLYPYQQQGMMHLAFTGRAILADEMGLGKTVQAIAACELLRRTQGVKKVLIVATTSLKSEWEEQIAKFCNLPSVLVVGPRPERLRKYRQDSFFYITNYEQIMRDKDEINNLIGPDIIILDEAQRIKNWRTKTAKAIKSLKSKYAFVLTGTPLENRIDDIYSIVQFLDHRFFGSLFRFNREFYNLDEKGKPISYKNLDILHDKLKPILLRRRKSDVEGELPKRTVNNYFVKMTEEQLVRYGEPQSQVAQIAAIAKRRPLFPKEFERLQKYLAMMRMLCDTPYILDQECRICPKLDELKSIFEEIFIDETNKIIIFSEWEKMLILIKEYLQDIGIEYSWHTGSVNQKHRPKEIQKFKNDPNCRVFLSTDAGSVGLNLQVANIVINMDLPWNPAKLEQRIARAWRKHQTRSVQVINLVSEDTIEHRMLSVLKQKQSLADNVLESGDVADMDIPSGRDALMERLEEVLGNDNFEIVKPAPKEENQEDPRQIEEKLIENIKSDIISRFQPRLETLELYNTEGGGKKIIAVLEGDIKEPAEQIQSLAGDIKIEVMNKETYDTIKRLSEMGVISLNKDVATDLYSRSKPTKNVDSDRDKKQKLVKEAKKQIDQAEHNRRMSEVLQAGGFYIESYQPLCSAFEELLKAFAVFTGYMKKEEKNLSISLLDDFLVQNHGMPVEALSVIAQTRSDKILDSKEDIENMASKVKHIFEYVEGYVNKSMLEVA